LAINEQFTENIANDAALIVYPFTQEFPIQQRTPGISEIDMTTKPAVLISLGAINAGFTRSKKIGSMEVSYKGYVDSDAVRPGNWVVFKTSASGKIKDYIKDGIPRFIGQIYSVIPDYYVDGNGKKSRIIKISIREWSHVLFCPVRYDQYATAGQGTASTVSNIKSDSVPISPSSPKSSQSGSNYSYQKEKTTISIPPEQNKVVEPIDTAPSVESIFAHFRQPFQYVLSILALVSNMSKNIDSVTAAIGQKNVEDIVHAFSSTYKVNMRMPGIPTQLVADHIYTTDDIGNYDPLAPMTTGFLWPIIGVQKWDQNPTAFDSETGLYDMSQFRGSDITKLTYAPKEALRPGAFLSPRTIASGITVDSILNEICDPSSYDYYTDMVYTTDFDGSIKACPLLIVRDIPYSLKNYKEVFPASTNSQFKWTFYDDLPRTTIRLSSILRIPITQNILESPTYIRVVPNSNGVMTGATQSIATFNGTATIPSLQYRFGGKEMVITTYAGVVTPKGDGVTVDYIPQWMEELRNRAVEWHCNLHLWVKATLILKDSDYLISVGSNVRIPLGEDKPVIVGHVDSIDYRMKMEDTGQITNQIIVSLSRVGMQEISDSLRNTGNISPLPPGYITDLFTLDNTVQDGLMYMVQAEQPVAR
jgi:hypothetical protein